MIRLQSARAIAFMMLLVAALATRAFAAGDPWNSPPKSLPAGAEHKTFHSKSMNVEVGYNIYLPPDYATSAAKRFPVIYFLHGRGGSEGSGIFLLEMFDKAIRAGEIPPMIYVLANGEKNSGYVDSPDGTIMSDTAIIKELIPHIDETCRTIAAKEGRGIEGFSMGGQGAMLFAFKYPELFASAIGYGAGLARGAELKKELPAVFKKMHNDDIEQFDSTSAWFYARKNADKIRDHVAIKQGLGDRDQHLERNHRMNALLDELKIPHEYKELPGVAHDTKKVYMQIGVEGWKFHAVHFVVPKAAAIEFRLPKLDETRVAAAVDIATENQYTGVASVGMGHGKGRGPGDSDAVRKGGVLRFIGLHYNCDGWRHGLGHQVPTTAPSRVLVLDP